jgi:hypothetical protein
MMIDAGEDVDVIAIKGNRLLVRPSLRRSRPADENDEVERPADDERHEDSPLDFDFPQS